jgi:fructose-bisphosphate aldolase/2-amino-3,7-dideoxy-D-threo-hept-6-ulosonate synthase
MNSGKVIRLRRIFKSDCKTVIVAIDHGGFAGPMPGIENFSSLIDKIIAGGADAVILNPGPARFLSQKIAGNLGLILRIDGGTTTLNPIDAPFTVKIAGFNLANRLAADAVITTTFVGSPREHNMLLNLAKSAQSSEFWGLPLIAEMVPLGPKVAYPHSAEPIKLSARIAAELGADLIKTNYTQDENSFVEVVKSCIRPVLMAGGPTIDSPKKVLECVKSAIEAGAAGVAIGRNIWQSKDPEKMTRAIASIVHEGETVENATKML